jgi:RNA-binding protein
MRRIGHAPAFAIKGHRIQARAPMKTKATTQKPDKADKPGNRETKPAAPAALSSADRRSLRAQAHHLEPVVQVGHHGVTDGVIAAVKEALRAHELIKVRLHEPEDKQGMADTLAAGSGSTLCGLVGHTAILYKRHPKEPKVAVHPAKLADKPARARQSARR